MKTEKSLEEVWKWKESLYNDYKGMSFSDACRRLDKEADIAKKKLGLDKLPVYHLPSEHKKAA